MDPKAALDPFAYALEAIPTDDPDGAALLPDRDDYYADLPRGTVVFTGDLTLKVGDHTFHCLWTPGHTPGQLAVHVPEERVVFTGDTIFSGCQTWLMTSNVDQWLEALERIRALEDVDHVVPGPRTGRDARRTSRPSGRCCMAWKAAVADAVAKGWSREETIARVRFDDAFGPVDVGQAYMMDHIQNNNAGSLWDKLTATGYAKGRVVRPLIRRARLRPPPRGCGRRGRSGPRGARTRCRGSCPPGVRRRTGRRRPAPGRARSESRACSRRAERGRPARPGTTPARRHPRPRARSRTAAS